MIITTENLIIRPVTMNDEAELFRIYGDKEFNLFNPLPPFSDLNFTRTVLKNWIQHWEKNGYGNFVFRLKGKESRVIGFGGFSLSTLQGKEVISLGYKVSPEVWGHGYATEFTKAVLNATHFPEAITQIIARTHPDNHASVRVLQKSGFKFQKLFDDNDEMGLSRLFTLSRNITA